MIGGNQMLPHKVLVKDIEANMEYLANLFSSSDTASVKVNGIPEPQVRNLSFNYLIKAIPFRGEILLEVCRSDGTSIPRATCKHLSKTLQENSKVSRIWLTLGVLMFAIQSYTSKNMYDTYMVNYRPRLLKRFKDYDTITVMYERKRYDRRHAVTRR